MMYDYEVEIDHVSHENQSILVYSMLCCDPSMRYVSYESRVNFNDRASIFVERTVATMSHRLQNIYLHSMGI